MKKKILIGSIIAVVLLILVSFSSVVGYSSVENKPDVTPTEFEVQRIRELVQSIDFRKIIVNPDAVVDTIEEISTITEENEDVRDYIEKTSEEDCSCGDDSSDLEWKFPILCELLYPLAVLSIALYLLLDYELFHYFMVTLGTILNCYWA